MWTPLLIWVAGVGVLAVWLGFLPPPHATLLVRIRDGQLRMTRGRLRGQAVEALRDILQEAGVTRGFIAVSLGKRVSFSRTIPRGVHQRIRNVLFNL